jgi:hypothetical protein
MVRRRDFLKTASIVAAWNGTASHQATKPAPSDRDTWIALMRRLADPVLTNLANGTLKSRMPVEQAAGADRRSVTHLEALGRLMAGLAPWIELPADASAEGKLRASYAQLARRAIARAVDPASPDFMNFTRDRQPLVDAAFLAQGLLRAPHTLRDCLDEPAKHHLIAALESTRSILPGFNNWLLFSAMVEAGLKSLGAHWDRTRVDYAVREHEQWYKGDGAYGDGPEFHWDYYNSTRCWPTCSRPAKTSRRHGPRWRSALISARRAMRRSRSASSRPTGVFRRLAARSRTVAAPSIFSHSRRFGTGCPTVYRLRKFAAR